MIGGHLFGWAAMLGLAMPASGGPAARPQGVGAGAGAPCSLSRSLEGEPAATFVLRGHPQAEPLEILLVGSDWGERVKANVLVTLTLQPNGEVYKRRAEFMSLGDLGKALDLDLFPRKLLDDLSKATSFTVSVDGRQLAGYALPTAAKAVDTFEYCEREKLVEWGADRASFDAGAAVPKPVGNYPAWLTYADVREGLTSFTVGTIRTMLPARLTIGADGHVEGCELIEESGNMRLDAIACRLLAKRGQYEPARDSSGKPLRSVVV